MTSRHDCAHHGEIREHYQHDENDNDHDSSDEDDPSTINKKIRVTAQSKPVNSMAQTLAYRFADLPGTASKDVMAFAGLDAETSHVSGVQNGAPINKDNPVIYADDTCCSTHCFWEVGARQFSSEIWSLTISRSVFD